MDINDLADTLVRDIPTAALALAELREDWGGMAPDTVVLSMVGKAYARAAHGLASGVKEEFFAHVEAALAGPYQSVSDAVATGLLEAIISQVERDGADREAIFDLHAGPESKRYVKAWDEFSNTPR